MTVWTPILPECSRSCSTPTSKALEKSTSITPVPEAVRSSVKRTAEELILGILSQHLQEKKGLANQVAEVMKTMCDNWVKVEAATNSLEQAQTNVRIYCEHAKASEGQYRQRICAIQELTSR
jgi:hypothetical protein